MSHSGLLPQTNEVKFQNTAMNQIVHRALEEAQATNKHFILIVENLQLELQTRNECNARGDQYRMKERNALLSAIQNIMLEIIEAIVSNQIPRILIRNQRCWSNCEYRERRLKMVDQPQQIEIKFAKHNKSQEEFAIIVHLLGKIYSLLSHSKTCTKRELYYQDVELFGNQNRVDSAIDKISCLLRVPAWELGVLATSKGLVAGPLKIYTSTTSITDCTVKGGALIPHDVELSMKLETAAKYILLIEKDTIFQKLLDEQFIESHGPCILITGKGVPDMNTRVLVKCLFQQLTIPIFMLADADPYGIEIMSIYRFGSMNLAHLSDLLAVPSIYWIGVSATDIAELKPETEQLNAADMRKARSLLRRPYMGANEQLSEQVKLLIKMNRKCKIESIGSLSTRFLTDVYIPMKILTKQFI